MSRSIAITEIPYPEWVQEFRPHQVEAVKQVCDKFRSGYDLVFLDAPTGSGKTLIGEMVRRELGIGALYVCTDKSLQDQFVRDFDYSHVVKGRVNYPTELNHTKTCDDCTSNGETPCMWCVSHVTCPYQRAKREAAASDLAVLNTSYLLTEGNSRKSMFAGRGLVIADEADMLEGAVMGYVEYEIPKGMVDRLGLEIPKKGVHRATLVKWLRDVAETTRQYRESHHQSDGKLLRSLDRFRGATTKIIVELEGDLTRDGGDEDDDKDQYGIWVRDYDTRTFKMKPLVVSRHGRENLWGLGEKWLLMSASLVSPEEMVQSLGYGKNWSVVEVPMTFPVENRPIVVAPVAEMTYRTMQDDAVIDKMANALARIIKRHEGERVLVHTGSYRLNRLLAERLLRSPVIFRTPLRVFTYNEAWGKQKALAKYLATPGAVFLAPSAERGLDLPGDACRVQVIAKVPYPSMGDRQVSGRMRLPGGDYWYQVQTARELVQMTGRGVRSETDSCVTYVLDGQFGKMWRRGRAMFPGWWNEAVDVGADVRWIYE